MRSPHQMNNSSSEELHTIFVGRERIHIDSLESTNIYATDLLAKSTPSEGTAISASFQTIGRGQIGRYWYGSAGLNVMTSIILYPKFLTASEQFLLSIAISCAIRDVVEFFVPDKLVTIKWPNDIYVNDDKVAGMLVQNALQGSSISNTVVGIGINVNETLFPSDLPNPISILLATHKVHSLTSVYHRLFESIERYYLQLRRGERESLTAKYIGYLYKRGEVQKFLLEDGQEVIGIIKHVEAIGKLVVNIEGKERSFAFRELRMVINQ